ncbi:YihY/virulence factor BrkB family protein [Arcanobacterium haemolyticum]|nr:YihY/virulence factor BrkB family protein [Arcanobacterium haemolyticum]
MAGIMEKVTPIIEWVQNLRVMRGMARYGSARGGLLAGGIAYSALFSIAAAATIAWSAFMAVLGSHESLREQVIDSVNGVLSNFLNDGTNNGLIDPNALVLDSAITPASIIAACVFIWTAISMISALATSIRSMFGLAAMKENPALVYARSLGGFVVMGVGVLASAAATIAVGQLWDTLGLSSSLLRPLGYILSFLIDGLVVYFLIRVVAIVKTPLRDALIGCGIAALGMTIVRILGTSAVGSVSKNSLLASFAALATLLLWINLWARILLISCAIMANPPKAGPIASANAIHANDIPNYVTLSAPHTLDWPHDPITGTLIPEERLHDELIFDESGSEGPLEMPRESLNEVVPGETPRSRSVGRHAQPSYLTNDASQLDDIAKDTDANQNVHDPQIINETAIIVEQENKKETSAE